MAEQKVAIVTAASRGMGAACARELAANGYQLALMARSPEAVELAKELNGIGLMGSVADEADLNVLVSETVKTYGRIDAVSSSLRAALANFTKLYTDKYAEFGIRMNNVLPGFIENYEISDDVRETIPMKRAGRMTEISKTVTFLLSEDAGYITGQNIRVDGGLTRSV